MRPTEAAAVDHQVGGRHGWRIVAALAVTQTVGYGVLYYSFAVLLAPIARTLDASPAAVTGALTTAVLAGAVIAVPVGRWLDRHGGRALMTAGSVAATVLVLVWSQVQSVGQLYAVMAGIGLTYGMVLYEPALAVVVSWFDDRRRANAVLGVILVAGFASTIFFPLTAALAEHHGWRRTLIVLAVLYGVVAIPLHAGVIRRSPTRPAPPAVHRKAVGAALRDGRFWCLAVAFVAHALAMSAMAVHLVGFLTARGHAVTVAATIAGLLGVLSVTGRLVLTAAHRRAALTTVVATVFTVQGSRRPSSSSPGARGSAPSSRSWRSASGSASPAWPPLNSWPPGTARWRTAASPGCSPPRSRWPRRPDRWPPPGCSPRPGRTGRSCSA